MSGRALRQLCGLVHTIFVQPWPKPGSTEALWVQGLVHGLRGWSSVRGKPVGRYPDEVRERAVRTVFERQDEYRSLWNAISRSKRVAQQVVEAIVDGSTRWSTWTMAERHVTNRGHPVSLAALTSARRRPG